MSIGVRSTPIPTRIESGAGSSPLKGEGADSLPLEGGVRVGVMRWLRRALYGLFAILVLAAFALIAYRQASLPDLHGSLKLSGIEASVDVVRDAEGIPHVYAQSDHDAWFTLGFVHAQDRLWQMEMNRRIAAGRVAEVLGRGALDADRFLRTLGVARNAAAIVRNLDASTRNTLESYAAGVNANLELRRASSRLAMPPEFLLTGAPFPEPWTPADSIGWSTMMAWDLLGNWTTELLRMRLAQKLTKKQIDEFLPPYREPFSGEAGGGKADAPLETADYTALYRSLKETTAQLSRAADAAPPGLIEGMGSNNWVVSGARSASGKPLLANDLHLGLSAPALWYFAHLHSPSLNVIGATLPGLPFVVLGHNDRIAWGFTNTGPDTQDLFIEELRQAGGRVTQVRTHYGWRALDIHTETIKVKSEPDVTLVVRASRHGPLVSDVSKSAGEAVGPLGGTDDKRYAIAFAWTALMPDDKTVRAGIGLNRARNRDEFVSALRDFHSPQQNIVYADVDGGIGFIAPGRIPVRKSNNDLKGQAPAPGWDARYDWMGFVPFPLLPQRFDPPNGRIVTANHKVVPDDYVPFLTSEWAPPYRARRIEALIDAKPRHDLASFAAIQADRRSLAALEALPLLMTTAPSNASARTAMERLARWDGTMDAEHPEPAIYAAWMRELSRLVYADELGPDLFAAYWDQRHVFLVNVLRNVDGQGRWCDDLTTPEVETCVGLQAKALDLALADLGRRLGPDIDRWKWGALHPARSEHRPFARVPMLSGVFDLRVPTGGDANTVNVGRYTIRDGLEPFASKHAASLRAIYDLADLEQSRFIHSTGQSGNRLSPLYANFVARWAAVRTVPMQTRREAVEKGAMGTLTLQPRQP